MYLVEKNVTQVPKGRNKKRVNQHSNSTSFLPTTHMQHMLNNEQQKFDLTDSTHTYIHCTILYTKRTAYFKGHLFALQLAIVRIKQTGKNLELTYNLLYISHCFILEIPFEKYGVPKLYIYTYSCRGMTSNI